MIPNQSLFSSGNDIRSFFHATKNGVSLDSEHDLQFFLLHLLNSVYTALKVLRNQLSLKPGESTLSVQDTRLILVKEWLELSPGADDVFSLLEKNPQVCQTKHNNPWNITHLDDL